MVLIFNLAAHVKTITTGQKTKIKYNKICAAREKKKKTPVLFDTLICDCIYYFLKK